MQKSIIKDFGNKVRVRVSGILTENKKTLLLKHKGLGKKGFLWLPPGGGVEFGETVEQTLIREFLEETSLNIQTNRFLYFREFVKPPLHAIELYFKVSKINGELKLGIDPDSSEQIIMEAKWFSEPEIEQTPTEYLASDLKELILKANY
jgi:8-oxo-dGTP diphosphatase